MVIKIFKTLVISACLVGITACSQKKEDGGNTTSGPAMPNVSFIGASPTTREATNDAIYLESSSILDELDNPVGDNYKFTVTGDPTGIEGQPITLSVDGITFDASITVTSKDGKIAFYAKVPTKKTTDQSLPYRILAISELGHAIGRFYVNIISGPVSIAGEFKGTTYEDAPPYNGKKDPDEPYTIRGDGTTIVNVKVGPVLDQFGNKVDSGASVRLAIDNGTIVSPNPSSVGIEGNVSFSVQSPVGTGVISMVAEAVNNQNQVLARALGTLQVVRPHLQVTGGSVVNGVASYGNVFINEQSNKTFIVENIGNTSATNITFVAGSPFNIISGGTCVNAMTLHPGQQCTVTVGFHAGLNGAYQNEFRITGSPTSIPEATVVTQLQANAVSPAFLAVPEAAIDVPQQVCGLPTDYITYVRNDGDLPGTNFSATTPVNSLGQTKDTQIILPPADANPSTDPDAIINCGTTLPPHRKCRVIVRHTPTSLYSVQVLNGFISIDGQNPVGMMIRVSSKVGDPYGTIPLTITQVGSSTPATSMDLNSSDQVSVKAGPIIDACGNLLNNVPVNASISQGSSVIPSAQNSSFGYATFTWTSTDNINAVGTQYVTITSGAASGIGYVNFRGIKLVGNKISENIGQLLRVTYNPPKYIFYQVTNQGVIAANNITVNIDNAGDNWIFRDTSYAGGCEDNKLNVGETCTLRFSLSPTGEGLGDLTGKITVSSIESGQNSAQLDVTAHSVNAPTMTFTGAPTINMGSFVAGTRPEQTITLTNNSADATVNNLDVAVSAPFQKLSTTCGTTLAPLNSCQVTVKLSSDTRGTYNTTVTATSEYASTSVTVSATIIAGKAAGTIALSVDKTSVPANPTDGNAIITVTGGPIKDAYNNNVVAGTVVNLSTNRGIMSVDNDNDGLATIPTGSGINEGKFTFTIRARSVSEIGTFLIGATVVDNSTIIASGSVGGAFTGANLAFTADDVDFGQVAVGALEFRTITLKNNGNESATNITWSTSSTDFSLTGQGGCTSLSAGAQCNVTVLVNPVQPGSLSGVVNINASGNGIISDTINVTAQAVAAAKLVAGSGTYDSQLKNYPQTTLSMSYIPGFTSSISFKARNIGQENLVDFSSSIASRTSEFSLSVPPACSTLGFGQECTLTLTFNPSSAVPQTINNSVTLTGESPSRLTSAVVNIVLTSPQMVVTLSPPTALLNTCSAYQVQLQDSNENGVAVGANTSFNLTKSGGSGNFYSNSGCSSTISSITINSGQSSSNIFYYKGTTTGDHTLTISNTTKSVQTLTKFYTVPSISPNSIAVAPNDEVDFVTSNGVPPYLYQVVSASGGTIDANSGVYFAPSQVGSYTVRVTDNIGNTSDATVTVEGMKLTAGRNFMCYLSSNNKLRCIGDNGFGQWGVNIQRKGSYNESIPVVRVNTVNYSIGSNVKNIYGGGYNLCVTNQSNRLYCQGANQVGTVGDNTYLDRTTTSAVSGTFTVLDAPNTVSLHWGLHTCAINSSNLLYCWGHNNYGQVGKSNSTLAFASPQQVVSVGANDFKQVTTGVDFTCALRTNGQVVCFGRNNYGQLGDNTGVDQSSGGGVTVLATSGATPLTNIKEISAGRYHICAVDNSGILYCWGRNNEGQVGNNTLTNQLRPVQITTGVRDVYLGGSHSCLVRDSDGQILCWGKNTNGQLGVGNTTSPYKTPQTVSGIFGQIDAVALGENFSCVIQNGSSVKCSGDGAYGVLAKSDLSDNTTFQTVSSFNNPIMSCMSGGTYNNSLNTCSCSSSANLYGYETKACSAAYLNNQDGVTVQYGFTGTAQSLNIVPTQASTVFSNIPVNYTRSGNGVLNYNRLITGSDLSTNYYFQGSLDDELVTATIGSLSVQREFRLYQYSCQDELDAFGDLVSGPKTLTANGSTTYGAYCYVIPATSTAYTYTNSTDYTRHYLQSSVAFGGTLSVSCPAHTSVVWQNGSLTDGTTTCNFVLEDLIRTGYVIDSSICTPLPAGASTATGQWNCQ